MHACRSTLEDPTIPGSPPDLRNPPPGCRFAARCPYVMDVCREVVPPEVTFGDGVRVACHLYPHRDAPVPAPHVMPHAAPAASPDPEAAG